MENAAYYNGTICPIDEMMIPANDRGFYFGDGIYEACMVFNRKIFALDEHLDRLWNSARLVEIELPFTREELTETLYSVVNRVDADGQFLYWQVTRGTAPRNHIYPAGEANLYIYSKPMGAKDMSKEYKLISTVDTRFHHCNIKTLNLLLNCMAATRADKAGCNESIFVRDGYVTECAHSNIHIVKDGVFCTHPADNLVLPGIERKHLLAFCAEEGIPTREEPFTLEQLMDADEIIVSSTSGPVMRATMVDGKPCAGKNPEIVELLRRKFHALIEKECG